MAWLSGFAHRLKLVLDHTKISDHMDKGHFEIHLSDSCGLTSQDLSFLFSELGENKKKLLLTKSDGITKKHVVIQKWDVANKNAWLGFVGRDISATTDTVFYLYFDKDAPDQDLLSDCTEASDDFTGDDGDIPDYEKWYLDYYNRNEITLSGNKVSFVVNKPSGGEQKQVCSKFQFLGDFDIQVDISVDTVPEVSWWWVKFTLLFAETNYWCYIGRGYDGGDGNCVRSRYNDGGTSTTLDKDMFTTADKDFTLRLVRQDGVIYFYYKTTGDWVLLGNHEMGNGPVIARLEADTGTSPPTIHGTFDNYQVNSSELTTGWTGRSGQIAGAGVYDSSDGFISVLNDSQDLNLVFTQSNSHGDQGLACDGTYFYWGHSLGTGVNGRIYKLTKTGEDVIDFPGPPHSAGGSYQFDNDTILFCSGSTDDYEVWEISKTGTQIQTWDLHTLDYGSGGLVAYKGSNQIYMFTSNGSYDFTVRLVTLNSDGSYVDTGEYWSHTSLGTPQGLCYVNGYLYYLSDLSGAPTIHRLMLRSGHVINPVRYDTTDISVESEGLTHDGTYFYFGDVSHELFRVSELLDVKTLYRGNHYIKDESLYQHRVKKEHTSQSQVDTAFPGGQEFDGSNDYLISLDNMGSVYNLKMNRLTIEAIAMHVSGDSSWGVIVAHRKSGITSLVSFRKSSSDYWDVWYQDDDGTDIHPIPTSFTIADDTFHHLVSRFTSTTYAKLYKDGSEVAHASHSSFDNQDLSSMKMTIGCKADGDSGDKWNGTLALIREILDYRSPQWVEASRYALLDQLLTISLDMSVGDIIAGIPEVGSSTLTESNPLAVSDIIAGTPSIGASVLVSIANLSIEDLITGISFITTPTLTIPTDSLVSQNILCGNPDIELSSLTQIVILSAQNIFTASPIISAITIGQIHNLVIQNMITGAPVIGLPTLTSADVVSLTAVDILSGVPSIGTPALGHVFRLFAHQILTGAPYIEVATLTEHAPNLVEIINLASLIKTQIEVSSGIQTEITLSSDITKEIQISCPLNRELLLTSKFDLEP